MPCPQAPPKGKPQSNPVVRARLSRNTGGSGYPRVPLFISRWYQRAAVLSWTPLGRAGSPARARGTDKVEGNDGHRTEYTTGKRLMTACPSASACRWGLGGIAHGYGACRRDSGERPDDTDRVCTYTDIFHGYTFEYMCINTYAGPR